MAWRPSTTCIQLVCWFRTNVVLKHEIKRVTHIAWGVEGEREGGMGWDWMEWDGMGPAEGGVGGAREGGRG